MPRPNGELLSADLEIQCIPSPRVIFYTALTDYVISIAHQLQSRSEFAPHFPASARNMRRATSFTSELDFKRAQSALDNAASLTFGRETSDKFI